MDMGEITKRLLDIRRYGDDPKFARDLKEQMYVEFIDYVSRLDVLSGEDLQDKATMVLSATEIPIYMK